MEVPGNFIPVIRNQGAKDPNGTVEVFNDRNERDGGYGYTEFITVPIGDIILQFELLDTTGARGGNDDFFLPMASTPTEDHRLAPLCASCGIPWHGPYGGPPGHVPNAKTARTGQAAYWVSLQVFREGAIFRPKARRWIGFARAAAAPGQAAQCGTIQQIHLRLAMESHRIISKCIHNAKVWWPHLFHDWVQIPYANTREVENRPIHYGHYGEREHSFIPDAETTYRLDAKLLEQNPNFSPSLRGPTRWEQLMSRSDATGAWSFF